MYNKLEKVTRRCEFGLAAVLVVIYSSACMAAGWCLRLARGSDLLLRGAMYTTACNSSHGKLTQLQGNVRLCSVAMSRQ